MNKFGGSGNSILVFLGIVGVALFGHELLFSSSELEHLESYKGKVKDSKSSKDESITSTENVNSRTPASESTPRLENSQAISNENSSRESKKETNPFDALEKKTKKLEGKEKQLQKSYSFEGRSGSGYSSPPRQKKRIPSKKEKTTDEKGEDKKVFAGTPVDQESEKDSEKKPASKEETYATAPPNKDGDVLSLGGKVKNVEGLLVSSFSPGPFSFKAYAAGCPVDQTSVKLHELDADGEPVNPPLAEDQLSKDAFYKLDIQSLIAQDIIDPQSPLKYLVRFEGCEYAFDRMVTGFNLGQHLDFVSNLFSRMRKVEPLYNELEKLQDKRGKISGIMRELEKKAGSLSSDKESYNELTSDTELTNEFQETFEEPPSVLLDSPPEFEKLGERPSGYTPFIVPSEFKEEQTFTYEANTSHWHTDLYTTAYQWFIDGVEQHRGSTWNYTPGKNEQGEHQIKVIVGRDDGTGAVDTSKPHRVKTWDIEIEDTYPVNPPTFTLASSYPGYHNSTNITLQINTGTSQENCETFDAMAITENESIAPDPADFTLSCTTAGTQNESFTLDPTNENKTIRLWAIDSIGNISQVAGTTKSASVVLDTVDPNVSLDDLVGSPFRGGTQGEDYNLNLSSSDLNGIQSLTLSYAPDGSTFGSDVSLSTSATSHNYSFPADDTTQAKLRLLAMDAAGNTSEVITSAFQIDSTLPTANLSSPPTLLQGGESENVSFSYSDDVNVANVKLLYTQDNWSSQSTLFDVTAPTSPFAWNIPTHDSSQSALRLMVTDTAGNVSTSNSSVLTIDSTNPAMSLSLSDADQILKGGDTETLNYETSDTNGISSVEILYAADGSNFSSVVSNPTLSTGTSDTYNWSVPLQDNSASKLKIVTTDNAGNQDSFTTSAFLVDSTAPTLSIDDWPGLVQGGANRDITFSASDNNTLDQVDLEYAQDGSTFSTTVATNPSSPYTWTIPLQDNSGSKLRIVASDQAGNSATVAQTSTFTVDSTDPAVTLDDLPSIIQGSDPESVTFSHSDANGISSVDLEFAADGTNFSSTIESSPTSPYSWSVPSLDTTGSKLRLVVTDNAGNTTIQENSTFAIDSTPPAAPNVTRYSPNISGSTLVETTVSSCSDRSAIFLSESSTAPDKGDAGWQTCTTALGGHDHNLVGPVTQGAHTLYVWAKDSIGNVSSASTVSMIYDTVAPSINFSSLSDSLFYGGETLNLSFSTSDANGISNFKLQYAQDGSTFSDVTTLSAGATSYNWTAPTHDTTDAVLRLVSVDNSTPSNSDTLDSATFELDSTPPAAPVASLDSPTPNNSTSTALTISSCADRPYILVNESTQPSRGDSAWQSCSTTAGAINYTIGATEGTHNLKVWSKDAAGNVSTGSDTVSMEYDVTPPNLTITSPADGSYAKNSVVMEGACVDGLDVNFSGDMPSPFNITCSGGTYSQTVNFTSGDGNKTITLSETDAAGNTTTVSRTFINDTQPPSLARTSGESPTLTNNDSVTWGGTCEADYTITVTGDTNTSFDCNSGSWSWTSPTETADGTYNYSLTQTDAAGNTSTSLPLEWTRDNTPPNFTMDQASNQTNNKDSLTLSGACEGTNPITISGAASDAISCSSGTWSWTTPTVSTDTTRNYTFTQTDPATNTSTLSLSWTRDTSGPDIKMASNKEKLVTNTDTVTFSGTCDTSIADTTVTISGAGSGTTSCNSGSWSWTTASTTTDGSRTYNFSQTDSSSNTTTVSGLWIRETNAPTVSSLSTSASDPSRSNFVPTDMTASSANTDVNVSHFCLKSDNNTQPTATDECWIAVNSPEVGLAPSNNLNLDEYYNLLGWEPKTYTVYAFVKDEASNISQLSSSGSGTAGTDKYTIGYDPGIPPSVANVIAANSDDTGNPPTRAEGSVPAGTDVYIRWKAWDNVALPSGAISLYYTEDEQNFTPISGAQNLDNANYGCPTVTLAPDEGCFKWDGGSPLNTSYKIQVVVTDAMDISTKLISNPLNTGQIKLLAGNTESGLGGSAQTAMFYTHNSTWHADPHSLVMTKDGELFFADEKRGILTIDREDGKQKIFIPETGSSTGDGGAATSATLQEATKINLDYQNRLLILDNDRIRRVDLNVSPPTIETIIGGGSSKADTVSDPRDVDIYAHRNGWPDQTMPFFALPNGDIYFMSERPWKRSNNPDLRFRVYKAATGEVISKYLVKDTLSTDQGSYHDPNVDLSNCQVYAVSFKFNPMNSEIEGITAKVRHHNDWTGCERTDSGEDSLYSKTYFNPDTLEATPNVGDWASYRPHHTREGLDGNTYHFVSNRYVDRINYDGTHTRILGSGSEGVCPDGTAPTSCNLKIHDIFIDPNGKIYFIDDGTIRTINENGNVKTIAGQRPSYGDGVNALNARFRNVQFIGVRDNEDIITGDNYYFKEFTIEGNINVIAGNGNRKNPMDTGTSATNQGLYDDNWFVINPANGDIYVRGRHERVMLLDRSTNMYEMVSGCGSVDYWDNDGASATNNKCHSHRRPQPLAWKDENILMAYRKYNSTDSHWEDWMWKNIDTTNNYMQSHIAGTNDPAKTYDGGYEGIGTSGNLAASEKIPHSGYAGHPTWDSNAGRWIFIRRVHQGSSSDRQVWSITPGSTLDYLVTLPREVRSSYEHIREGSADMLYYCNGNKIYKHDLTNDTDLGALPWSMSTMQCNGYSMHYNSTRNTLIFPFLQNGLSGVAEYYLP